MVLTPNNRTSPSFTLHRSLQCFCPHFCLLPSPLPSPSSPSSAPPCLPPAPAWAGSVSHHAGPGAERALLPQESCMSSAAPSLTGAPAGLPGGCAAARLAHPECLTASQLPSLPAGRAGQSTASTLPCLLLSCTSSQESHGAVYWHWGQAGAAPQPSLHSGADSAVAVPLPAVLALAPQSARGLRWPHSKGSYRSGTMGMKCLQGLGEAPVLVSLGCWKMLGAASTASRS